MSKLLISWSVSYNLGIKNFCIQLISLQVFWKWIISGVSILLIKFSIKVCEYFSKTSTTSPIEEDLWSCNRRLWGVKVRKIESEKESLKSAVRGLNKNKLSVCITFD